MAQGLAMLERLVKENPARAEYRFALAEICRSLGLPVAEAIPRTAPAEAFAEAEELMRRSVALLEALVRESPGNRDYRCSLADAQNDLGVYFEGYSTTLNGYSPTRNLAECERWFQRRVETLRGLLGPTPSAEDLKFRIRLAASLHNRGGRLPFRPDTVSGVLGYYAESHQLLTDVLKLEPNNEEALMALGITLLNWGSFSAEDPATRAEGERSRSQGHRNSEAPGPARAHLGQTTLLSGRLLQDARSIPRCGGPLRGGSALLGSWRSPWPRASTKDAASVLPGPRPGPIGRAPQGLGDGPLARAISYEPFSASFLCASPGCRLQLLHWCRGEGPIDPARGASRALRQVRRQGIRPAPASSRTGSRG